MSVRIALLGNSFAEATQLPALKHAGGNEVIGIAGRNLEKAQATAARWGIPKATDDWRELLTLAPDLVIISTPVDLHFAMAKAALESGAAVLCEKPFTLTVAEAKQLARLADGKLALIDHQLRWSPLRRRLRERVRENYVGKVFHVRSDLVIDSPRYLTRPHSWWFEEARGGGTLGALSSHLIDNLIWILGPVASVNAQLSTFIGERENAQGDMQRVTSDDHAELWMRMECGALVSMTTSVVTPGGSRWLVEIAGSEGTMRLDLEDDLIGGKHGEDMHPLADDLKMPDPAEFGMTASGGFAACEPLFLKDVIAAVAAGQTSIPEAATFQDGVACMRVLEAARYSSSTGGGWTSCK
jgi:predicted dehydrogenase